LSLLVEREIVSSEFGSVVDAVAEQANAFGIGPPQITLRLRPFHPERFPDRNSGYLAGKAVQTFDRSRDYTEDSLGFRFDDGLNCSSARRRWIAFHN
jgi:hypothetical protein